MSSARRLRRIAGCGSLCLLSLWGPALHAQVTRGFLPGQRVLLDAHNAYPERGRWADRLDAALATGTPVAIEQDLVWHRNARTGRFESVVAHGRDDAEGAPTLERYFFDRIRPLMEQALASGKREDWPLVTLNLDFKTNERAHHEAVWALLGKHEKWLTTATRTDTPGQQAPIRVGPMLVLTGSDSTQRARFHDRVAVGGTLRLFGAVPMPAPTGATREERARNHVLMSPDELIARRASNYLRWANFSWLAVEEGGAPLAAGWTPADSSRLHALVRRAHDQGFWVRFYTLDGFAPADDRGFSASYNFGSPDAAAMRWRAAIGVAVDFVATDQYRDFRTHAEGQGR